jgi:hypothetical protein
MRTQVKLTVTALCAALALAVAASSAAANRSLEISERQFTAVSRAVTFTAEGTRGECPVTFTTTLARTIAKTAEIQVGQVTEFRIAVERCTSSLGSVVGMTALNVGRAPLWLTFYSSFLGTLPNITGILLYTENTQVQTTIAGAIECLYEGRVYELITVREGRFTELRFVTERIRLRRVRGSVFCGENGTLAGTFTLSPAISVRLL